MQDLKEFWGGFNFGSLRQKLEVTSKGALFCGIILLADILAPVILIAIILLLSFIANVVFHSAP